MGPWLQLLTLLAGVVGEKTGLLTPSEIKTLMIKVELVKYFRFMRNHGAESEDWTVRWPFSPAEIDLSILTALWILQPVTTWKSILRLFVFSSLSDKWLELPPGAFPLEPFSPGAFSPGASEMASLVRASVRLSECRLLCLCDSQTPPFSPF